MLQDAWMSEDFPGRRRAISTFQNLLLGLHTTQSAPWFPACKATRKNKTFSHFHVLRETTFGILKIGADIHESCHMIVKSSRCRAQSLLTLRPRQEEIVKNRIYDPEMEHDRMKHFIQLHRDVQLRVGSQLLCEAF